MKQSLFLALFTFYCANLFAFPWVPSEFLVEENGVTLKITCAQEQEPIANLGHIEKIENFLDCNNQPIETYCECIANKFENKDPLSPDQIRTLETEFGFFGSSNFQHLSQKVQDIALNQQVLSMYGDDENEACLDINKGGPHATAYKRILSSTKNALEVAKVESDNIPAYVNSKYIDEALASQGVIMSGKTENFDNEMNQDYEFLKEIAKSIAKVDPNILLKGKTHRDKVMNFGTDGVQIDPALRAQYTDNKALVPWQNNIKEFIVKGEDDGDYANSPIYKSMKRTFESFGPYEKGKFTGKKQIFFEKMIQAVKKIGFEESDLKKLANDTNPVIDDSKFKKRLDTNKFKDSMKPFAKELCANSGAILLQDVRTNVLGGKEMNAFNEGLYRYQGRSLMSQLLNINPKKVDGVKDLMRFSSIQNRLFSQMAKQFDHLETKTEKDKEDISHYILDRKDQMGRLWCGANYVSTQIKEWKEHVLNNDEDKRRFMSAKLSVSELEAQNKKVQSDLQSLENEFYQLEFISDDMDSRIVLALNDMELTQLKINGLGDSRADQKKKEELKEKLTNLDSLINNLEKTKKEEDDKISDLLKVINTKEALASKITRTIEKLKMGSVRNFDKVNASVMQNSVQGINFRNGQDPSYSRPSVAITQGYLNHQLSDQVKALTDGKPSLIDEDVRVGMDYFKDARDVDNFLNVRDKRNDLPLPITSLLDQTIADNPLLTKDFSGAVKFTTGNIETVETAKTTQETLEILKSSAELGLKAGVDPELTEDLGKTIVSMVNNSSDNLESSNATEEVKAEHKESVVLFDDSMDSVLGDMKFTARGEREKPKNIRRVIEESIGTNKRVRKIASMGKKPKRANRLIPREIPSQEEEDSSKLASKILANTEKLLPMPPSPSPSALIKAAPLESKRFVTSSVKQPKSFVSKKLDTLSSADVKAILSKRMTSRVQGKKTKIIKPKKIVVDPKIQKLRDEIEKSRILSQNLDSQIKETSNQTSALKERVLPTSSQAKSSRTESAPVVVAPKSNIVSASKKTNSGSISGGRSPASSKSLAGSSGGGGSAASAASSSAIEGRVSGGVVVNGEFIPSSLLARNIDIDGIRPISSESIVLGSKSSYEVKTSTNKSALKGKPRVKSATFSSLSVDKKEEFIQKELIRLKTDSLVIENSDGSEVVVKSKVRLRTRMKVADLNALFEKVDE
ncbi:MAG: hypothetical protein ACJAT2_002359 [Bacteriovoracaceae bacterium]|jgi:hypothetical protein